MSQIDLLYRLQQIDTELRQQKKRLTELFARQKEDAQLRAAQTAADDAAAEAERGRRALNEQEQLLASNRRELQQTQDRLYSGKVRNPKELEDLERKIEALKRRRSTLEDAVLEAMVVHEEAVAASEEAATVLAEIVDDRAVDMARWQQEQHDLALAIDQWMTKRQKVAPRIEAALMKEYQRTSQRRGGVAVAGLKGGVCQGCQVRIPANVSAAAVRGELAHCSSCGRILSPL